MVPAVPHVPVAPPVAPPALEDPAASPFVEFDREAWSRLRRSTPMTLSASDVVRLQGLGDRVDLREVEEVYLPLSRLLTLYVEANDGLREATATFLGEHLPARPRHGILTSSIHEAPTRRAAERPGGWSGE